MTAIVVLARAAIRSRWRSILAISVLVGFAGTAVLASAAGARRTASALERFKDDSASADVEIIVGDASAAQLGAFERTDGVAAIAPLYQLTLTHDGEILPFAAALDERFGTVVDRARVLAGRLPELTEPNEIAIGEALAGRFGVGVGDQLTVDSYSTADVEEIFGGDEFPPPGGPRIRFDVVGIVRRPLDLGARGAEGGIVAPTPAFLETYPDVGSFAGTLLRVRTDDGAADVPRVGAAARRIFGESFQFGITGLATETEGARDAIGVLAFALWLFAGIVSLAGVVAVGIVVGRQVGYATDQLVLGVLGLTRRQRAASAAAVAFPMALGGALVAGVGAAIASPLLPLGLARKIEPDPGFHIDWLVLGIGLVAVVGVVLVVAALAAARLTRSAGSARAADTPRPSAVARAAANAGLGAPATTGLRMALERGRAHATVPVRSAFAGAAFGILGVVAVLTFASSLHQLVSTPRLYGWTWDIAVTAPESATATADCSIDTPRAQDPEFSAVAAVCVGDVEVDGHPLRGWGFTSLRGTIEPTVVAGRAPHGPNEIALGAATLDELGKDLGDVVDAQGIGELARFRVVGRVALPTMADQPLAHGATFDGAGFARLADAEGNIPEGLQLLIRLAPGADVAQVTRRLNEGVPFADASVVGPQVPVEIDRLRQVDQLPAILGALLASLAAVAVGHALVTAVRHRRRDLAILKTLGFDRRQVRATVAWQATALSAGGLVVGIPIGLVAGGVSWRLIADGLGVSTAARVSILALVLLVPGAIALANLVAAVPAHWAARTRPAVVLRSD